MTSTSTCSAPSCSVERSKRAFALFGVAGGTSRLILSAGPAAGREETGAEGATAGSDAGPGCSADRTPSVAGGRGAPSWRPSLGSSNRPTVGRSTSPRPPTFGPSSRGGDWEASGRTAEEIVEPRDAEDLAGEVDQVLH